MAEMQLHNAFKLDCGMWFPETAMSVKLKIRIEPADAAVLITTPRTSNPVRFNGPASTADVPVRGHEMYLQKILGCTRFEIEPLGYKDDVSR